MDDNPKCPRCRNESGLVAYLVPVNEPRWEFTAWGHETKMVHVEDMVMFHCRICGWYDAISPSIDQHRKERIERQMAALRKALGDTTP